MATGTAPTDQRASVRPISFVLDNRGYIGSPVTLTLRPEDLTRNEPSRATVHQTLGREVQGWVDNFGQGLPSVTIAGHTGWGGGGRPDGVKAFEALHELLTNEYPASKQAAIDTGVDPATVKLLYIDTLNDASWNVVPLPGFVLRRSKSRPLLLQYNITLQAISTSIDSTGFDMPFLGNISSGLGALGQVIKNIQNFKATIQGYVDKAVGLVAPIGKLAKQFMEVTQQVYGAVNSIKGGIGQVANSLIGTARDLSYAGLNIFRTISAVVGLPNDVRNTIVQVAASYNEALCIFSNSLRQRGVYEEYEDLYGASNCSSTTGGRPVSPLRDSNVFELIQPAREPVTLSPAARVSLSSLKLSDPVLRPLPPQELGRHTSNIVDGFGGVLAA